jgi:hypothetical protein
MTVTKTSPFSGNVNTLDIDVTARAIAAWESGELIQVAMPNLTADEREFIKTGITAKEWEESFGGREINR